jgi:hypothetical protein
MEGASKEYQKTIGTEILNLISQAHTSKYAILDLDEQYICKSALTRLIEEDEKEGQTK